MSSASKDREKWNQRYRAGTHIMMDPDLFLVQAFHDYHFPTFPHGATVLDFAGGAGRHSIFLAQRGWRVTLVDIAEDGINRARQNAGALGSHIHFVVDDLTHFRAAQTQFDVVMVFFYLDRQIFPEIANAVRPGGLLLYKTYTVEQRQLEGGPSDPTRLLDLGELRSLADGLEVLHYRETISDKATAELVARRPRF